MKRTIVEQRTGGITDLMQEVHTIADPEIARHSLRFFKTAQGEYGEGDIFLGIRTPVLRGLSRKYKCLRLTEIHQLLQSPFHEIRLLALFLLVFRYQEGSRIVKEEVVNLYLAHTAYVNNWDLVDASAANILGEYFEERDRSIFYQLASSQSLWERRIAMIATHRFIKNGSYEDTLRIIVILMNDKEDLIQKACGWMLREVGKNNLEIALSFLDRYAGIMPRTMLRYSLERLPLEKKNYYMASRHR